MTRSRTLMLRSLALVFSSALVVACNSGGGSSSKPSPAPSDPTVTEPDMGGGTGGTDSGGNTGDSTGGDNDSDTNNVVGNGDSSAELRWTQPTQNTDGSALRDLVGYKVSLGLSPNTYSKTLAVDFADLDCQQNADNARVCSYTIKGLETASWYFAVKATDMDGNDSAYSNEVVVTVQ